MRSPIEVCAYFNFKKPRRLLNGFTAAEVNGITALSLPMISYLLRAGYLAPFYGHGPRGKIRYPPIATLS